MNEWIEDLADLSAADERIVIVTVAGIRGSAPREVGAKMLVTAADTIGTIGGGQLEYQCTRLAVGMLESDTAPAIQTFPLGAAMGQCCGGVVEILFEPVAADDASWIRELQALHGQREAAVLVTAIGARHKSVVTADKVFGAAATAEIAFARELLGSGGTATLHAGDSRDCLYEPIVNPDFNIAVFGAGHVGSAVVASLAQLDCNIRWIDSRRHIFRAAPRNARTIETTEPALEVTAMPAGSFYLVMTHSHALDFDICDRILRRNDARYCGLIGSRSKRRRFEKRFREQGMPDVLIESLVCPIGVDGISGKKPAEIAVAVAAELLQAREQTRKVAAPRALPDNVRPI
ncbi:MAG: xanthine dehydrogenase accessory protein XdhC [Woeseiaceae bacterium]|nr:xanthine dehydrogenase accessory protein XdhC [Woeseiaceae bacterium]